MIANIVTITGEEYTGDVSGFINLAHGNIHEPLSSKNFGICLYMRIAPITFNTIDKLEVFYGDKGNNPCCLRRPELYKKDPMVCMSLFFQLKDIFINKQFLR